MRPGQLAGDVGLAALVLEHEHLGLVDVGEEMPELIDVVAAGHVHRGHKRVLEA